MDGGAFVSSCQGSLFVYAYFTTEVSGKIIQNKHTASVFIQTQQVGEGGHLFPQELDSSHTYYVRRALRRCAECTVSEEFSKMYGGPLC